MPRAPLRQIADFVRHHRESQSGFARAGRFHGGVQGQDVGLEGNLVDHLGDLLRLASS
jgi:hypothetical protein